MNPDQDRLLLLLLAHRAMLLGYITSIVREAHLAEDVFQNVALIVLNKGHQVSNEEQFPGWARKVARLEALSALRKQKKAPRLLDQAVLELLEDHWRAGDAVSESAAAEALRGCLEKLSPRARRLIELRFVQNLSGKALAANLAQPVNTVYVSLSRIYRVLSSCIKRGLAPEGVLLG
jgi:RNA polymerase sigma-70 factor (ECF subfamily)